MEQVLVTGGAGPVGSHVVDRLRREGVEAKVLDNLAAVDAGGEDWLRGDVTYVHADRWDGNALVEALRDVEVLFHLGPVTAPPADTPPHFGANATPYLRVLSAVRKNGFPLRRAIVASSQAVYPEGTSYCPEHARVQPARRAVADLDARSWDVRCPQCGRPSSPVPTPEAHATPDTPYARSALRLERLTHALGETHGIATTVVRFPSTYGRRQTAATPRCGFVGLAAHRLLQHEPVLVYEDGSQLRDFVHVDDVARALLLVADDSRTSARTFNLGTGTGVDLIHVVSTLAALLDVDGEAWLPGRYRCGDARHLIADVSQLRTVGWTPKVELVDGLEDYAHWLRLSVP